MSVKFSVIIPTYNRLEKVQNAIESVLVQSYTNFHIIVVDDCSTDQTFEKLSAIYGNNTSISILKLDKNSGACAARNRGIGECTGDWVAFLDADDRWKSNKLEVIADLIEVSSNVGLVYSSSDVVNEEGDYVRTIGIGGEGNVFKETLLMNKIGGTSRVVAKIDVLKESLFDEAFPSCQDWELWIRISRSTNVANTSQSLVLYEEAADSISSNCDKALKGWSLLFDKHRNSYIGIESSFYLRQYLFLRNRGAYSLSIVSLKKYLKHGGLFKLKSSALVLTLLLPMAFLRLIYNTKLMKVLNG